MNYSVARNINTIIAKKGLLKKSVAQNAGFTEQQFSAMLTGRKRILAEYIPRISAALGVEPNDIYADESNIPNQTA